MQQTLWGPPMAQSRRSDPAPAKRASAENVEQHQSQASRILKWLWVYGWITADTAYRELAVDENDGDRGDWSARIGVLCSARGGRLVERHGERDDRSKKGKVRSVTAYRLTADGVSECARMFGGQQ